MEKACHHQSPDQPCVCAGSLPTPDDLKQIERPPLRLFHLLHSIYGPETIRRFYTLDTIKHYRRHLRLAGFDYPVRPVPSGPGTGRAYCSHPKPDVSMKRFMIPEVVESPAITKKLTRSTVFESPLLVAHVLFVDRVFPDDEGYDYLGSDCADPLLFVVDQELLNLLKRRQPIASCPDASPLPDVISTLNLDHLIVSSVQVAGDPAGCAAVTGSLANQVEKGQHHPLFLDTYK